MDWRRAVLDASGGLEVGSHTSIGLNVVLWTHTGILTNITMSNEKESSLIMRSKRALVKVVSLVDHLLFIMG